MDRDLTKTLRAQKNIESLSSSKFDSVRKNYSTPKKFYVKLTSTITQECLDYLNKEALKRSGEKGKLQSLSQTLREVIEEHGSL